LSFPARTITRSQATAGAQNVQVLYLIQRFVPNQGYVNYKSTSYNGTIASGTTAISNPRWTPNVEPFMFYRAIVSVRWYSSTGALLGSKVYAYWDLTDYQVINSNQSYRAISSWDGLATLYIGLV